MRHFSPCEAVEIIPSPQLIPTIALDFISNVLWHFRRDKDRSKLYTHICNESYCYPHRHSLPVKRRRPSLCIKHLLLVHQTPLPRRCPIHMSILCDKDGSEISYFTLSNNTDHASFSCKLRLGGILGPDRALVSHLIRDVSFSGDPHSSKLKRV